MQIPCRHLVYKFIHKKSILEIKSTFFVVYGILTLVKGMSGLEEW